MDPSLRPPALTQTHIYIYQLVYSVRLVKNLTLLQFNDVEIFTTSFSSLVEKDWLSCHICGDFLPTEEGMKVHLNR
jgi:hypothetical protein